MAMGRLLTAVAVGLELGALWVALGAPAALAQRPCVGDCDAGGAVAIHELVIGVGIALGSQQLGACPVFDASASGAVEIDELITAVGNALGGCEPCPVAPGMYRITQASLCTAGSNVGAVCNRDAQCSAGRCVCADLSCGAHRCDGGENDHEPCDPHVECPDGTCEGGNLTVASLSTFDFPTGGSIVQDVGAGNADCVHEVVVPFPGGFTAPVFCIPSLGFTVEVVQAGCGVGRLDSDGGSDYTLTEIGDTSDTSAICLLPHRNCEDGADSAVRIDVTVGDGAPDTCARGTANVVAAVPVHTTTWIEHSSGNLCGLQPGADGTYDPGTGDPVLDDFLVVEFPQILDFTTDRSTTMWSDLDGDGCTLAGRGPARGFTREGVCLDLTRRTLSTAASGPIGSSGRPLFDLTFATFLPNTFTGPEPLMGATCETPPVINFAGLAHRCIGDSVEP